MRVGRVWRTAGKRSFETPPPRRAAIIRAPFLACGQRIKGRVRRSGREVRISTQDHRSSAKYGEIWAGERTFPRHIALSGIGVVGIFSLRTSRRDCNREMVVGEE